MGVFQASLFLSQSGEISLKKTIDLVSHFREQLLLVSKKEPIILLLNFAKSTRGKETLFGG
jgi:hypothetical protein